MEIIKYVPDSSYYANFKLHGTTTKNVVMYEGPGWNIYENIVIKRRSNIVGYNLAGVICNWNIILLDGTIIYSSPDELQYDLTPSIF